MVSSAVQFSEEKEGKMTRRKRRHHSSAFKAKVARRRSDCQVITVLNTNTPMHLFHWHLGCAGVKIFPIDAGRGPQRPLDVSALEGRADQVSDLVVVELLDLSKRQEQRIPSLA